MEKRTTSYSLITLLLASISICMVAQTPTFRVDFDMANRPKAEVNEPGYISWPIETCQTDSRTIEGVEITLSYVKGSAATALKSHWYKAGVQAPYYARLVNDGLTTVGGDGGAEIEITFSGLPAGKHSLMTYHNTVDNPISGSFCEINIDVDGVRVIENLVPSSRALSNFDAQTAYINFEAKENTPVTFTFTPNYNSTATFLNIIINGFVLNEPNIAKQALYPDPVDGDFHVDADNKLYTLKWNAAKNAVLHDIYIGTNKDEINAADTSSPCYKGRVETASFNVTDLYSMNTYYWRVDEIEEDGEITKGNVWSFRPRQLAFPGAEGYGRFAIGGRGGKVVYVTNLNDDGPGSLREAITNDIGPRTIVFAVSGIIELKSRLTLSSSYVTIAGQTAPGKGICITRAPLGFSGVNDGIMRFVRVRLGSGTTYDGMGLQGSGHCILDHNSISWTIDEAFSSRSGKNITLQRTLISEALNAAGHQNYPPGSQHGYAASISGDIGSFHHNLLAHCAGRNWSLAGGLDGDGFYAGRLDIFNNVVYNWKSRTTDGGAHEVNFVKNYYKPGAASTQNYALNAQWDGFPGTQSYYCDGNIVEGKFEDLTNLRNGCKSATSNPNPWSDVSFFPSYATVHSAHEAYKHVLSDVGCTLPLFDDHDKRIINETLTGTYSCRGSYTNLPGLPDSEQDVGGWENYPEIYRSDDFDTDKDGLPDWWETMFGLNPNSLEGDFSDANADDDEDGFTNLEEYLHWMATPHFETGINQKIEIDLAPFTKGFEKSPVYTVSSISNATAEIKGTTLSVTPDSDFQGLIYADFTVSDEDNSSMVRTVGLKVGSRATDIQTATNEELEVSVYPNPIRGNIYIHVANLKEDKYQISVSNIYGKTVLLKDIVSSGKETCSIDSSSLLPGIYFVTIKTAGGQKTIKVIKE